MRKSNFLPFTPIKPCQNHLDTRLTAPTPPKITSQKHLASKALKYSAWSLTRYQDLAWYQLWQQVLFLCCLCLSSCLCAFVPVATSVGVRDYPSIFHLTGLHMAVTYGWGFTVCVGRAEQWTAMLVPWPLLWTQHVLWMQVSKLECMCVSSLKGQQRRGDNTYGMNRLECCLAPNKFLACWPAGRFEYTEHGCCWCLLLVSCFG